MRRPPPDIAFAAPIELHVLRHGQTVRNAASLRTGSSATSLTERGREEARAAGRMLEGHYATAVHSGLERSRQTLELALGVASATVDKIVSDTRLTERSLGVLEGEPRHPLPAYASGDLTWAPEGGEPYLSVATRVWAFLADLPALVTDDCRRVIVCTHAGPLRLLAGILRREGDAGAALTARVPHATVQRFEVQRVLWPGFLPSR